MTAAAGGTLPRFVRLAGLAGGTCILVLAYMDGARPVIPGMPRWLGLAAGAVAAWLIVVALSAAAAALLRRHHRAIASHAYRHGKRGVLAGARTARKGGQSATTRLAAWAGPRWSARLPVAGGLDRALPQSAADRREVIEGGRLNKAQRERDANGQRNICAACGNPGTPGDPLIIAADGFRIHTSDTTDPKSGYYGRAAFPAAPQQDGADERVRAEVWRLRREAEHANLRGDKDAASELETRACDIEATLQHPSPAEQARMAAWQRARAANRWLEGKGPRPAWLDEPQQVNPAGAPAPAAASQNGDSDMAPSRINPDRRAHRAANNSGGKVPSEWGPVVAAAADFEPDDDAHLLNWMADQVAGMAAYAEGLIEAYETGVNSVGIDPKGLAALHDVADAAAHAAETMHGASGKFADHYELPREFAANGGVMTHDGRWVTGEGG